MGMCEWVSDSRESRESAWLANPCELRIRITGLLYSCTRTVPTRQRLRAYGRAIRTISRRLGNHCRIRANPFRMGIHANCESASQLLNNLFRNRGMGEGEKKKNIRRKTESKIPKDETPGQMGNVLMLCCFATNVSGFWCFGEWFEKKRVLVSTRVGRSWDLR